MQHPKKGIIIAIDGPAAAGKGTLAPILARQYSGYYLQTGAMYRCIGLYCLEENIALTDDGEIALHLPKIQIMFAEGSVLLNGKNVTETLKESTVASASSTVATIPAVRNDLVERQQTLAEGIQNKGQMVIAEGRDTGTRVFPDAEVKIFLTAAPEIRAQRRLLQLEEQGEAPSFEDVLESVQQRDKQDQERAVDPLVSNPEAFGYWVLDDSELTEEQTLEKIRAVLTEKNLV